jgi:hypothetical protein
MFHSLLLHNNVSKFQCGTCAFFKHHRVSFSPSINKSDEPFVLVHTDVWGPSGVVSLSCYRWFVSFIDNFLMIFLRLHGFTCEKKRVMCPVF